MPPLWFSNATVDLPRCSFKKKIRRKSPSVRIPTQMYQGKAIASAIKASVNGRMASVVLTKWTGWKGLISASNLEVPLPPSE